jgi:hypothetical protein
MPMGKTDRSELQKLAAIVEFVAKTEGTEVALEFAYQLFVAPEDRRKQFTQHPLKNAGPTLSPTCRDGLWTWQSRENDDREPPMSPAVPAC